MKQSAFILESLDAASERIRLERLLELLPPASISVPIFDLGTNHSLLQQFNTTLMFWGFHIIESGECCAIPSLLHGVAGYQLTTADIVRDFVVDLSNGDVGSIECVSSTVQSDLRKDWRKLLPLMPRGLLAAYNNRACRTAIMFNDLLDERTIAKLFSDLKRCFYP